MDTPIESLSIDQAMERALLHHREGRLNEAEEIYRKVLQVRPDHADALHYLGVIDHQRGKHESALELIERALFLSPGQPIYLNSKGQALRVQGRLDEAQSCYELALKLRPDFAEVYSNLGNLLLERGQRDEAVACYEKSVALKPEHAEAHNNLGAVFNTLDKLDEAEKCFHRALALRPDFGEAHNNLGGALMARGNIADSIRHFRAALVSNPLFTRAYSNLLFAMNFSSDLGEKEIHQEHLEFARRFEDPLLDRQQAHANVRNRAKRLVIGYVSPDFRDHVVGHLIEPILSHHDQSSFEVICYSSNPLEDAMSQILMGHVEKWRNIHGIGDDTTAQMIREDGVDILVDLAGHTARNRLLVFARKPAPVQVTWLGYPNTTGLSSIDYRITDRTADPIEHTALYSEELIYMPDVMCCLREYQDDVVVNALPAIANGYVTFGSFNNFSKLGAEVIATWAMLLNRIPLSRLLFARAPPDGVRNSLRARFGEHGISPGRIEFAEHAPRGDYLTLHHNVDIALDPFPCNGGATTCDSLWMGVPVVSLAGGRFVSRTGASFLRAVGLAEWVAQSKTEYMDVACARAADLSNLILLRGGLRARLLNSPLMDAKRFTGNLEAVYRAMWERYCIDRDV